MAQVRNNQRLSGGRCGGSEDNWRRASRRRVGCMRSRKVWSDCHKEDLKGKDWVSLVSALQWDGGSQIALVEELNLFEEAFKFIMIKERCIIPGT